MGFAAASDGLGLFLGKVCARSELSAEEQEAVLALPATPRRVEAHRDIVRAGETVEQACLVADGLVARFAQMEDGQRQLVSLHLPGDMPDLHSLVLPAAPAPLVALAPTTLFHIPHSALRDLTVRYPAIAAAFWRECVVDSDIIAQWLVSVGRRDARGRLAHLLCEMAVRSHQLDRFADGAFLFPITQEQMADALGLTPVHVNRTLRALREEKLVRASRGEIVILDWEGLVFAAGFDPAYLQLPALPDSRRRALAC